MFSGLLDINKCVFSGLFGSSRVFSGLLGINKCPIFMFLKQSDLKVGKNDVNVAGVGLSIL